MLFLVHLTSVALSKQRPRLGPLVYNELSTSGSTVTEVMTNTRRLTGHLSQVLHRGSRIHTRKHSFFPKINAMNELNLFVGRTGNVQVGIRKSAVHIFR